MIFGDLLNQYNAGITSIIKIFLLYILSKWYGISFGFPFIFLFFRIYQIIINKKYNLSSLLLEDQYLILNYLFFGKIFIKEMNITKDNGKKKEDIIKKLKDFLKENYFFKRRLVYKYNNYYWRNLDEHEIDKIFTENLENLEKQLNKKFFLLKEPPYKIFINENENNIKIIVKYNSLIKNKFIDSLISYLNNNVKEKENQKHTKLFKLFFDFITYPIQLFFEILIILFLPIKS